METAITFEQVDAQIKAAGVHPEVQKFTATDVAKSPGDVLKAICSFYHTIKGILKWVLPILPQTWKDRLQKFMDLLDQLCPE